MKIWLAVNLTMVLVAFLLDNEALSERTQDNAAALGGFAIVSVALWALTHIWIWAV